MAEIMKVDTGNKICLIYDYPLINGKTKRLYACSEEELSESISRTTAEEFLRLSLCRYKTEITIECINYCIDDYSLCGVSKSRTEQLKFMLSCIECECLLKNIYDVTEQEIEDMFFKLSAFYSKETLEFLFSVIKKVFMIYDAVKLNFELTVQKPCKDIIMLPSEYNQMIDFCNHSLKFGERKNIILFSLLTGISFSVLCSLQKKDILFSAGKIIKDNKTYLMNKRAKKWLCSFVGDIDDDDYLFLNEKNEPFSLSAVCRTLNNIVDYLFLPCSITGKTIQQSFIVWCIQNNEAELPEHNGCSSADIQFAVSKYEKRKIFFK